MGTHVSGRCAESQLTKKYLVDDFRSFLQMCPR